MSTERRRTARRLDGVVNVDRLLGRLTIAKRARLSRTPIVRLNHETSKPGSSRNLLSGDNNVRERRVAAERRLEPGPIRILQAERITPRAEAYPRHVQNGYSFISGAHGRPAAEPAYDSLLFILINRRGRRPARARRRSRCPLHSPMNSGVRNHPYGPIVRTRAINGYESDPRDKGCGTGSGLEEGGQRGCSNHLKTLAFTVKTHLCDRSRRRTSSFL
ncbi:hypothetical protein EVAR_59290_1 [Eumeta japonica]|uniref:Uncharacterized protein n=1 Tax=Eumeta variegata TaxID=151549 RepID=A0A4C1YDD9_EUMVA|nr:hypothetical protein EVAR_59290_1 [Eumeta japonica]